MTRMAPGEGLKLYDGDNGHGRNVHADPAWVSVIDHVAGSGLARVRLGRIVSVKIDLEAVRKRGSECEIISH